MSDKIEIANRFFGHYASAVTDSEAAYKGMHQYLDDNVTFSDMAYDIKGKQVFAMWHWFCIKPVRVIFDPAKTKEVDDVVILTYRAQYLLEDKPIDYEITAHLTIKDSKIIHHKDEADMMEWAKQAKGTFVAMIAWTPFFKKELRHTAKERLDAFIEKNPVYKD
ncbi:hypothetical protein DOJK_01225 [Patescibacteria group bacterium]|nr:hypothetical protein DOJK_01225 [Patescibacteria group bacterium]